MTLPWGCISKYLCFCSCCLKQVPQRSWISIKKMRCQASVKPCWCCEALLWISPQPRVLSAAAGDPAWDPIEVSAVSMPPSWASHQKGSVCVHQDIPLEKKDLFMKSQTGRIYKHCIQTDAHFMYNSSGFTLCIIHLNRPEGQVWPGNTSSN